MTNIIHKQNMILLLFHTIKVRPRLIFSIIIGLLVYFSMPYSWNMETRGLVSWNIAAIFYLILFFHLAETADVHKIKTRAKLQDDGAVLILIFSGLAAAMCFVAIAFELANLKGISGADRNWHLALVILTIPLNWAFIHSMYALHYAHEFYDALDAAGHGLEFPSSKKSAGVPPTYWDFIYFSYIIGTSGQTADVGITCPSIRKTATIHCVFSFFFNLTTLGLSINVASSLF
jgi:uncharacterized membrane protein